MCVDDGGQDACVYNVLVRMSTLYIGSQELVPILKSLLMLIMWCCCWCVDVCVVYWEVTEVDVVIYCLYVNIWRPIPIVFVDVIVMLLLMLMCTYYVGRWGPIPITETTPQYHRLPEKKHKEAKQTHIYYQRCETSMYTISNYFWPNKIKILHVSDLSLNQRKRLTKS